MANFLIINNLQYQKRDEESYSHDRRLAPEQPNIIAINTNEIEDIHKFIRAEPEVRILTKDAIYIDPMIHKVVSDKDVMVEVDKYFEHIKSIGVKKIT